MCQPTSPGYSSDGNSTGTEPPTPRRRAQRPDRSTRRMRTTARARYRRPQTDYPPGGDPHNGTSPRRPVAAHALPGKCLPDGFPARGGDVRIDGTAHGDVPVPLELLDLAAVHGTSLPNTRAPGIRYPDAHTCRLPSIS